MITQKFTSLIEFSVFYVGVGTVKSHGKTIKTLKTNETEEDLVKHPFNSKFLEIEEGKINIKAFKPASY